MGLVAVTVALFGLGACLGRNLAYQWGLTWLVVAFLCLLGIG